MAGAVAVSSWWGSASSGGGAAAATQAASLATMGGTVARAAALPERLGGGLSPIGGYTLGGGFFVTMTADV